MAAQYIFLPSVIDTSLIILSLIAFIYSTSKSLVRIAEINDNLITFNKF
jgi:hypothetical protein